MQILSIICTNFLTISNLLKKFLIKVEEHCSKVGLPINAKKTEFMSFTADHPSIKTVNGSELDKIDDFRYLGSWINDIRKDINCGMENSSG